MRSYGAARCGVGPCMGHARARAGCNVRVRVREVRARVRARDRPKIKTKNKKHAQSASQSPNPYPNPNKSKTRYALILYQPNPARPLPIARAQPDVVRVCKADFYGKVWLYAVRIGIFSFNPCPELKKTFLCAFHWNSPLCCVLWVLIIPSG